MTLRLRAYRKGMLVRAYRTDCNRRELAKVIQVHDASPPSQAEIVIRVRFEGDGAEMLVRDPSAIEPA